MRWSTSSWRVPALLLLFPFAAQAQDSSTDFTPPPESTGTQATSQSILSTPARTPNTQYSNLLGNLLWFYDEQRSGVLPADHRVPWRNNSLVDDGEQLSNVDLSGGYYDAGNFIKATFPLSWTQQSIAWGASVYGLSYALTNQAQYLDGMLRWGYDWMLKASNTPDTLWVQVSSSAMDTYWGGDQNIPSPRPAYQVNRTSPGTDAFAAAAAAFAAGSFLYSGGVLPANASSPGISTNSTPLASIKNATYATALMQRAVSMWDLATTSTPMQVYQTVVPQVNDAYPSTDYFDDLTLAGLWLAIATGNKTYADTATTFYGQMLTSPNTPNVDGKLGGPLNWDQKSPATALLFVQAAKYNPELGINASRFQGDMDAYLDSLTSLKLNDVFLTPATRNSSGLLWFPGNSDSASLNPAMNAAFLMHTFSGFADDAAMGAKYRRFGDSQFDYLLGANPMNAVYVSDCGVKRTK
jgi:endoglucanase